MGSTKLRVDDAECSRANPCNPIVHGQPLDSEGMHSPMNHGEPRCAWCASCHPADMGLAYRNRTQMQCVFRKSLRPDVVEKARM